MRQKLSQISQMIQKFKDESRIIKPSQQVLDTLKSLMEQIDSSITNCKESHFVTLNELEDKEKLLSKEIDAYDKKILAWNSNNDNGNTNYYMNSNRAYNSNTSSASDKLADSNLLKEVVDFDVFNESFIFFILCIKISLI
jgi:hypothetical protein